MSSYFSCSVNNVTHFCVLGLGAGFPVLKKTQRVVTDENSSETPSQVLLIIFEYHIFLC